MREVVPELRAWRDAGVPYALATVVGVLGSAPRAPGATVAVNARGEVVGSVSGGCVEGAVYDAATEVLATGAARLDTYGVSDEDSFAVGLTCGGIIDVLVRRADPTLGDVLDTLARGEPVAVATVAGGPAPLGAALQVWPDRVAGTLGHDGLDASAAGDARRMLADGVTGTVRYGPGGEHSGDAVSVFVQSYAPPPRMLVFGAIDHAGALARIGRYLGYRVTICDARPVFATARRFPDADEVVCAWPHAYLARTAVDRRTVICVLTHDPKFDVPLLVGALRTPAGYVGAMGSRRTHERRVALLRERGVTPEELARLAAPIGLDLGGHTPEETALAIAAEIVAARHGGTGRRLSTLTGPIHAASTVPAG